MVVKRKNMGVVEVDIDGTEYTYVFVEAGRFTCSRCGRVKDEPYWANLVEHHDDECRTCSPQRRESENPEIIKMYEDRETERERLNPSYNNLASMTGW